MSERETAAGLILKVEADDARTGKTSPVTSWRTGSWLTSTLVEFDERLPTGADWDGDVGVYQMKMLKRLGQAQQN
jgi:hypothetical protein